MHRPPHVPQNYRHCPPRLQWTPQYGPRYSGPFHNNANPRFRSLSYRRQQHLPQNLNEEYWCETCDRGFPTMDLLDKHNQQHQKCNIDGCTFVAHPKVITKHIQMQHSTGLFKKIGNLNNPEAIKKWLEERKKKYPTKINVERKAAEIKEKIQRGEKMGLKHDKNLRNHHTSDKTYKRKQPFNENEVNQKRLKPTFRSVSKKSIPPKNSKNLPALEVDKKLQPFAGIQDLLMDDTEDSNTEQDKLDFFIEDDDESISCIKKPELHNNASNEPVICGALSSLIGDYGSSDEEINTIKQSIEIPVCKNNKNTYKESEDAKNDSSKLSNIDKTINESDNDSGPVEVKVVKKVEIEELCFENDKVRNDKNKSTTISKHKKPIVHKKCKPKIASTLLQKLLHREILHERNIVLQCIRHIIKHHYFDKK